VRRGFFYLMLRRRFPSSTANPPSPSSELPTFVIVGAGFGGLAAARRPALVQGAVTLIDRRNYPLFQPLLYQVATASLSLPISPPRSAPLLREQFNTVRAYVALRIDGRAAVLPLKTAGCHMTISSSPRVRATITSEGRMGTDCARPQKSTMRRQSAADPGRLELAESCADDASARRC